jgi:hypothetical protein
MVIGAIYRQILHLTDGLQRAHGSLRNFLTSYRGAICTALWATALLTCSNLALAANPKITSVAFTGPNVNLRVVIFGTGFGPAPPGVPCTKCSTPYLKVVYGRGDSCQVFNISSWTPTQIVFSGVSGDPGDAVLVLVKNPQNHLVGISSRVTIPRTIEFASPRIKSVTFAGLIGRNLEMTILGSGFGVSPPNFPFVGNLLFFAFADRPFEATGGWTAGYAQDRVQDTVTLKYGFWSPDKIVILGFGGAYGKNGFEIRPNDLVLIFVANSATCGLGLNSFFGPTSIAAAWGGHLP